MQISPVVLLKGLVTYVPGALKLVCGRSYGTDSARYCYSVWLRHLVRADAERHSSFEAIAELGPGDSLGIGIAALLTGSDTYYAFDAKPHANLARNAATLQELVTLFSARAPIPGPEEFPDVLPSLRSWDFPHRVLTGERMQRALAPERLVQIRRAIAGEPSSITLAYAAPWWSSDVVREGSVDFVFSQAVLEHVDELDSTYRSLYRWLRPGGLMSHAIDFRSHGLTRDWYGHWTVGDRAWRLIRGRRPYLINRAPASDHLDRIARSGFRIITCERSRSGAAPRLELTPAFRGMPEEDLGTSAVFLQAIKEPAEPSSAGGEN